MITQEQKPLFWTNTIVIILTFVLFTLALFYKGFTHDLLLELGVFLISAKLIISSYQIQTKLETIHRNLKK